MNEIDRAEDSFFKDLSQLIKKLPKSARRKDLLDLSSLYFSKSRQSFRADDKFDIDKAIKRSICGGSLE